MTGQLFPPSPQERLDAVEAFVLREREVRVELGVQHPAQSEYFAQRVTDTDRVLADIRALREHLHRLERELDSARRPIGGE